MSTARMRIAARPRRLRPPYTRATGTLTIFNCGSVGMPWDGDPRASYVLIDDDQPQVIRAAYDIEHEASLFQPPRIRMPSD